MKSIRNIAFSALLAVGAFATITYTSCNTDACDDIDCMNGGLCISGTCSCPTGYEGETCQTLSRDKFVGVYSGNETCTIGSDSYAITLSASSDDLKINYTNLYNQSYSAVCTITGQNTFSFAGTASGGVSFDGTSTLNANTITVNYTINTGTLSNTCTFIGTK